MLRNIHIYLMYVTYLFLLHFIRVLSFFTHSVMMRQSLLPVIQFNNQEMNISELHFEHNIVCFRCTNKSSSNKAEEELLRVSEKHVSYLHESVFLNESQQNEPPFQHENTFSKISPNKAYQNIFPNNVAIIIIWLMSDLKKRERQRERKTVCLE